MRTNNNNNNGDKRMYKLEITDPKMNERKGDNYHFAEQRAWLWLSDEKYPTELSINLVKNESDIFIPHPVGLYDVNVNIYFSKPDRYGKVSLRASVCDFVLKK
jgi:hypothetical protein